MNKCEVKAADSDGKIFVEIPREMLSSVGVEVGQKLYAYAIGSEGIWLSIGKCPSEEEFLIVLGELERVTKEAHAAVDSAVNATG